MTGRLGERVKDRDVRQDQRAYSQKVNSALTLKINVHAALTLKIKVNNRCTKKLAESVRDLFQNGISSLA